MQNKISGAQAAHEDTPCPRMLSHLVSFCRKHHEDIIMSQEDLTSAPCFLANDPKQNTELKMNMESMLDF